MTRIGLISDTHGFLDERVFEYFKDCNEVWHAGDFGLDVAIRLKEKSKIIDRATKREFQLKLNKK